MRKAIATFLILASLSASALAAPVYLEDMTWTEIRDRMKGGATTVIVPTGGTEQNGPHIVLGKHNYIVHFTSGEIARKLGNALAAPVVAYVPSGRITPPEGHMRFPGTVSVSETTLAAVLEDAARSLKQHGFKLICFVGDHGGSQGAQQQVADKLNGEWRGAGARVVNVTDYYGNNGSKEWAAERGIQSPDPSAHGGFMDTSEMLQLRPEGVRRDKISQYGENHFLTLGVGGDPREGNADYGRKLLSLKVDAAVAQIQNAESKR
jgi:creatinine amidohydrolase/Fe(II)-dependent formamide hydrolase-like protein